jgi:hypothetical protein
MTGATRTRVPGPTKAPECGSPLTLYDVNGGAVGQNFGHALGELGGVEAHTDDGMSAHLLGVGHHAIVGVLAGFVADLGVGFDVAAEDALDAADKALADIGRAHDDAAHNAEILGDFIAFDFVASGDAHGLYFYLSKMSVWPVSTIWPVSAGILATVPALSATISLNDFIASTRPMVWPRSTRSPTSTKLGSEGDGAR